MDVRFPFDWAYAHGGPAGTGLLRAAPEDFVVEEELGWAPEGKGEHLYLLIRKRGANTAWVARRLAELAGLRPQDVGYAGLKDRHAVTTQWFSLHTPAEPALDGLAEEGIQELERVRHTHKLQRGDLAGNRFALRVRELNADPAALAERLARIAAGGVPNYFGEQRFGHDHGNLEQALALFRRERQERDRTRRGLYLSAARSYLFNTVLSRRVQDGSWDRVLKGEWVVFDGSGDGFPAMAADPSLPERIATMACHPSGPMWGRGWSPAKGEAARVEAEALAPWGELRDGLEHAGLRQERRALRLPVPGLAWELDGTVLDLSFRLPAGSYATVVLRECLALREPAGQGAD